MSGVTIERVHGRDVEPYLEALAGLRIKVFREFPYLYEGSREYEAEYLRNYAKCPRSTVVLARAGERVVGASTAMPLAEHGEDSIVPALENAGYPPRYVYYFGESVLLPEYRGQRIGHAFFDQREASARDYGMRVAAFCAVERAPDHPARPADYVPHDAFWEKRGYQRRADIVANIAWRDVGDEGQSDKRMVFWVKELR
jgi:GNAT superfamily N-acetyltransferase